VYGFVGQILIAVSGPLAEVVEVRGHEQLLPVAVDGCVVHRAFTVAAGASAGSAT
jgi:hypothetical protein